MIIVVIKYFMKEYRFFCVIRSVEILLLPLIIGKVKKPNFFYPGCLKKLDLDYTSQKNA